MQKLCYKLSCTGVKFIEELHGEPWDGRKASFADPDRNSLEVGQLSWKRYFTVSTEGAKGTGEAK